MNAPGINELRASIERVDSEIIALIAERTMLARAVGQVKAEQAQPITDPEREAAVVARVVSLARGAGLPEQEIRSMYWQLVALSRRVQME